MIEPDTGDWSIEIDVAVVGAGGCGLVAAARAADAGAEVFVLEKMAVPLPNTTRSTGMIPAAGTRWQRKAGIDDSPAIFAADIERKTHGTADPALVRLLTECSAPMVEWLVDEAGVQLDLVTGFTYPGHSRHRMHAPDDRSGITLMRDLRAALDARPGIDVVLDAPVTSLVAKDGVVTGVVVGRGASTERVRARSVVLASNGFAANPAMVREYCPQIADALYLGGEGSTGEAIVWGRELGAATGFLDAYQGHSSVAVPHNVLLSYATVMESGILVNAAGERFGDETAGYSEFATEVIAQPAHEAYLIYDARIHELALAFEDYRTAVDAGAIRTAATFGELAQRLGIDEAALERTVEEYRRAARGHAADRFGRADCRELEGELHGVRVSGALFHTQGGLMVDEHARVVRADGSVVEGLYAGGGAAAGVSGSGASGYMSGNGLLSALGLGWLAGQHAGSHAGASTSA